MQAAGGGSKKRARAEGSTTALTKADINRILSVKSAKDYPYATYGRQVYKRGEPAGLAKWGRSARTATPSQRTARALDGIIGSGMYQSNRGMYRGRGGFFEDLGGKLGDLIGPGYGDMGKAGRTIGSIGDMFSGRGRYTGRGTYSNSLISMGGPGNTVPTFAATSARDETGALTITHREYVCDIYGNPLVSGVAAPFVNQAFSLNPGIEKTFPFLSQLAANYEEYEMKQLIFTFRSTTSDIGSSTNGQVGTIIMATNYNAASLPFVDKETMLQYDAAASCKTTEPMMHGVECDPKKLSGAEGKYVRTNPVLVGEDLKTYDHGTFQLAVSGTPGTTAAPGFANQSIGELWVSYTVTLRKPKFYTTLGLAISRDVFVSGAGTETLALAMGTQAGLLTGQQNNIGCALVLAANQITVVFPSGYSGRLAVKFYLETNTGGALCNGLGTLAVTGNVQFVADMYASNGGTGDSPGSTAAFGFAASPQGYLEVHLDLQIATNATNNTLVIPTTSVGATASQQSCIEVTEYNSYGRQVLQPAPVLVNAAGTVVVP